MQTHMCVPCRRILQTRLRQKISHLQQHRRQVHDLSMPFPLAAKDSSGSWYWDTTAPTLTQLNAASHFFSTHRSHRAWTASQWHDPDVIEKAQVFKVFTPEVVFLGRSNVGKSTLLNALMYEPGLNRVGDRPGKTQTFHAWGLAARDPKTGGALKNMKGQTDNKVTVIDAPGYGWASDDAWGRRIMQYLQNRKQLRRVFLLINAEHGLKPNDQVMLSLLRQHKIPFQIVAAKCDRLQPPSKRKELLRTLMVGLKQTITGSNSSSLALGEILAVACGEFRDKQLSPSASHTTGVANLQWAVLQAAGLTEFAMTNYGSQGNAQSISNQPDPPPQPRHVLATSEVVTDPSTWLIPNWLKDELNDPTIPRGQLLNLQAKRERMSEVRRKSPYSGTSAHIEPAVTVRQTDETNSLMQNHTSSSSLASALWPHTNRRLDNSSVHNENTNTKRSPTKSESGSTSQLAGILEAIGEPANPPSKSLSTSPAPTSRVIPKSTSTGPSVTRGMDALMSLMGDTSKKSAAHSSPTGSSGSKSARKAAGRNRGRGGDAARSDLRSTPSQSEALFAGSKTSPMPSGPGVSRGLDALMALTGGSGVQQKNRGKARRRN